VTTPPPPNSRSRRKFGSDSDTESIKNADNYCSHSSIFLFLASASISLTSSFFFSRFFCRLPLALSNRSQTEGGFLASFTHEPCIDFYSPAKSSCFLCRGLTYHPPTQRDEQKERGSSLSFLNEAAKRTNQTAAAQAGGRALCLVCRDPSKIIDRKQKRRRVDTKDDDRDRDDHCDDGSGSGGRAESAAATIVVGRATPPPPNRNGNDNSVETTTTTTTAAAAASAATTEPSTSF